MVKNTVAAPKTTSGTPRTSAVLMAAGTIADTTWRVFVPVLGLLTAGLLLDRQYATKPWLMLAGTLVGALIATLLVAQQYKQAKQQEQCDV